MSGSHADKMRIVELEAEVKRLREQVASASGVTLWRALEAEVRRRGRTCSKLVSQRDRLERILAVERGDESQAPEGWERRWGAWYRHPMRVYRDGSAWSVSRSNGEVAWPSVVARAVQTALEAMEAADAALGGEG